MHKLKPFVFLSLILLIGLSACRSSPAEEYAKRFCDCSAELADATERKRAGKIDPATFTAIRDEQLQCMGELDDPRIEMTQEEINLFQQDFLLHIRQNCPNIGRNFGYELD